jgi:hypothetical protein
MARARVGEGGGGEEGGLEGGLGEEGGAEAGGVEAGGVEEGTWQRWQRRRRPWPAARGAAGVGALRARAAPRSGSQPAWGLSRGRLTAAPGRWS